MSKKVVKSSVVVSYKISTPAGYKRRSKPLKDSYQKVEELKDNQHNPNAPAHIVC